jgi:MHS family proline/betaine transporter-like MFS transporter
MIPFVLLMGYLSDRVGSKRIIQCGLIGFIFLSLPSFLLIESGNPWLVFLGIMLLAVFLTLFQGTMPSLLPSLFFTEVRYGGLSITYNVSTSLFGGTTPLVLAWLINQTNNDLVPAFYVIASSLIGIITMTYFVKDPSGRPLRGSPPALAEGEEITHQSERCWWKEEKRKLDAKAENQ